MQFESNVPLDHVQRPMLPWRLFPERTECGLLSAAHRTITREQLVERATTFGPERTRASTCVTCIETRERWPTFEEDPLWAVERELGTSDREQLSRELRALASLAAAHHDEFDAAVAAAQDGGSRRRRTT